MATMAVECALPPRLSCRIQSQFRNFEKNSCAMKRNVSRLSLKSRRLNLETRRLTVRTRAQNNDKEQLEVDKVEDKSPESWSSSVQRAPMVSRIFMAAFVWMSLFFGISVANNEMSGGRPGRRGPRK